MSAKYDKSNRFGFAFTNATFELRTGKDKYNEVVESEELYTSLIEILENAIDLLNNSDYSADNILDELIEGLKKLQ